MVPGMIFRKNEERLKPIHIRNGHQGQVIEQSQHACKSMRTNIEDKTKRPSRIGGERVGAASGVPFAL